MNKAKCEIGDLQIGAKVYGDSIVECGYFDGPPPYSKRSMKVIKRPFEGVLVGARYITLGVREYWGSDAGWTFRVQKRVFVFLVRESWLSKETMVLPRDLKLACEDFKIPIAKRTWPKEVRASLRKEMKDWPRDERGRWRVLTEEEKVCKVTKH